MKKILILAMANCLYSSIAAQSSMFGNQPLTTIQQGTVLQYVVLLHNELLNARLSIDLLSNDSLIMEWKMDELNGRRCTLRTSSDPEKWGEWNPPSYDEDIIMAEAGIMLAISKNHYADLKENGRMRIDDQLFIGKKSTLPFFYPVQGHVLRALCAETPDGRSTIWVLDNYSLPLILKLKGFVEIEVELTGLE